MFGFQANMGNQDAINEAMKICTNHYQCEGCPLVDKPMNIGGVTITCVNAQMFKKEKN